MSTPDRQPTNPRDTGRPVIHFGPAYSPEPLAEQLPDEAWLRDTRDARHLRARRAQVYFAAQALQGIRDDLAMDARVERGGLLVGHPFRDLDDPTVSFTVVVGTIGQPSRQSSVGQFTVTPEMISRARQTLEREFPGRRVVGWYHSHPGHGVFLSAQDMTIVRGIYNAPWQIAFVRDTLRDKEGVFYGPQGTRLDGWLELKTDDLDFIRAADLHGQLAEATPAARPKLLAQLREMVAHRPELGHWRRLGRYQGMTLEETTADDRPPTADLSVETLGVEELITIHESEAAAPPAADPTTGQRAAQRELERAISLSEEMEKREAAERDFALAKIDIDKGKFRSGLGILRQLAETHPGWPGLQEAIAEGEEKEQQAQARRPGALNAL